MKETLHKYLKFIGETEILFGHGNRGDGVITHAAKTLMQAGGVQHSPDSDAVIVMGGGGLIPRYPHLRRALREIDKDKTLCILPSTVVGAWDDIKRFPNHLLFSRELYTHREAIKNGVNSLFCDDLAFCLDYSPYAAQVDKNTQGTLTAFRTDKERLEGGDLPEGNVDLSFVGRQGKWTLENCDAPAVEFIEEINRFEHVRTDRLHIAIIAACLGKQVDFHPNNYFKNKAVYAASLIHYDNVTFHGSL